MKRYKFVWKRAHGSQWFGKHIAARSAAHAITKFSKHLLTKGAGLDDFDVDHFFYEEVPLTGEKWAWTLTLLPHPFSIEYRNQRWTPQSLPPTPGQHRLLQRAATA